MEDILASIRRILSEEDVPAAPPQQEAEQQQDVLVLDSSMLVADNAIPLSRRRRIRHRRRLSPGRSDAAPRSRRHGQGTPTEVAPAVERPGPSRHGRNHDS